MEVYEVSLKRHHNFLAKGIFSVRHILFRVPVFVFVAAVAFSVSFAIISLVSLPLLMLSSSLFFLWCSLRLIRVVMFDWPHG